MDTVDTQRKARLSEVPLSSFVLQVLWSKQQCIRTNSQQHGSRGTNKMNDVTASHDETGMVVRYGEMGTVRWV